jgi:hypothetical protein
MERQKTNAKKNRIKKQNPELNRHVSIPGYYLVNRETIVFHFLISNSSFLCFLFPNVDDAGVFLLL